MTQILRTSRHYFVSYAVGIFEIYKRTHIDKHFFALINRNTLSNLTSNRHYVYRLLLRRLVCH